MGNHPLSTNQASLKLKEDLGLSYTVGRGVVAHFFTNVDKNGDCYLWEQKPNYHFLIAENESIDQIKDRIKSKVKKFWFKNEEDQSKVEKGIVLLIPEKEKRRSLYLKAQKLKEKRGGYKLPNQVLIQFLIDQLGHYDKGCRGAHI
jgi:hypothetical protein